MKTARYPDLHPQAINVTRDALQAYANILGSWMTTCRLRRKHWWQISLRPSLNGLTTEVIRADINFELQLDFRKSVLLARTDAGESLTKSLHGQSARELGEIVRDFLTSAGVDATLVPGSSKHGAEEFPDYSADCAQNLAHALSSVTAAMETFRASIREETSPIQLWPHHFDLALLWLPGSKVPGQDPENEEYADQQMNFGFTFGDDSVPEPYFYITAYPMPEALPTTDLPAGTTWESEGFNGAVLPYRTLMQQDAPDDYLLRLWKHLLSAARKHMLATIP